MGHGVARSVVLAHLLRYCVGCRWRRRNRLDRSFIEPAAGSDTPWPRVVYDVGPSHSSVTPPRRFEVQVNARNGVLIQEFLLHADGTGGWKMEYVRFEFNGKRIDPPLHKFGAPVSRPAVPAPLERSGPMQLLQARAQFCGRGPSAAAWVTPGECRPGARLPHVSRVSQRVASRLRP